MFDQDDNQAPAASIIPPGVREAAAADAAPTAAQISGSEKHTSTPAAALPAIDYDAEARDLIGFAYSCFSPLYPSLAPIYTPDVRDHLATVAAPLMRKYNLSLGGLGPEAAAAFAVFPLIAPTLQAIRHDNQNRQAQGKTDNSSETAAPEVHRGKLDADAAGPSSDLGRFPTFGGTAGT